MHNEGVQYSMKNPKKLEPSPRGSNLDDMLNKELALMLSDGFTLSPISISALTMRLKLSSRSTLHTPSRKEKILEAMAKQRALDKSTPETQIRRKTQEEKIKHLEQENEALRLSLDHQIELMCRIVGNATARGWDVDYLLSPLRKNSRELVNT